MVETHPNHVHDDRKLKMEFVKNDFGELHGLIIMCYLLATKSVKLIDSWLTIERLNKDDITHVGNSLTFIDY